MFKLSYLILFVLCLGLVFYSCQDSSSPTAVNNLDQDGINSLAKKTTSWNVPGDFATIEDALNDVSVLDGHTIMVGPGNFAGAYISKAVNIKGIGSAVIDDGPMHPTAGLSMGFRLLAGSDGCTISHLAFEVDLAIMNGDAVNDVKVTQCTFNNAIQGISNWRGSGWEISHNNIVDLRTRCGGGIGIFIGDFAGGDVKNNVVSHNNIYGTLHVSSGDCGGYNGSGIVLYADFRWGGAGTTNMSNNSVIKNKVSMSSDTPLLVDIAAFELTDSRDDKNATPYPVIYDNYIGFNDWRGTVLQMAFIPEELEELNSVSRNLGDNRGHGLHPKMFGPGGN
ncbi:hypothetical protein ACFLSX_04995 [Calditrichota bacterium]